MILRLNWHYTAFFALALSIYLQGCATSSRQQVPDRSLPVSRVYAATHEEVEKALRQALIRYPPRVDNPEAGHFETEYIKGDLRYRPPYLKKDYSSGYRYRLIVRVVKGKDGGKSAVKVLITKQVELVRDFFSEPEPQVSDGMEEQIVLYRIQREILMDRALQKSSAPAS